MSKTSPTTFKINQKKKKKVINGLACLDLWTGLKQVKPVYFLLINGCYKVGPVCLTHKPKLGKA